MSEWRDVRLGELGEVNRGRSRHRPRDAAHLYGGPYPFIQTGDIKAASGRITHHSQTYSEAGLAQSRLWPAGTIAITIAANIGETAILTYPACFPDSVVGFIADPTKADARFIEYQFRLLRRQIQHENVGTGSVQDNINLQTLERLVLTVPPLKEQKAIASALGTLDDKIDLNRRMNETLEAMARAIFKDWFVDFGPTRAKMENREPYLPPNVWSLFPDRLDDNDKPEGWQKEPLGFIAQSVGKLRQPQEIPPGTAYVGLEHIPRQHVVLSEWSMADEVESGKLEFRRGDILFGKLRPYFHKVVIAPMSGVCTTDAVVMRARQSYWTSVTLMVASSSEFVAFTDRGSTGTKMPRTSWSEMSKYEVIVPSDPIARSFETIAEPVVQKMIESVAEVRILAATRDLLLPKLMSGEIRIEDAEKVLEDVL